MKMPAYIVIKQYRIVYIALLLFTCYLTWDMWTWYKATGYTLEVASAGAFGAAFLSALGMIKFGLEGLRKDSEHDHKG